MSKKKTNHQSKIKHKSSRSDGNHKPEGNHELLSKREMEILYGLANGYLYKEVAKECGISIDTVKKHCKNIYKKLQARNRMEAIKNSGAFNLSTKKIRPTRGS